MDSQQFRGTLKLVGRFKSPEMLKIGKNQIPLRTNTQSAIDVAMRRLAQDFLQA